MSVNNSNSGNITISFEEMKALRIAIIEKYNESKNNDDELISTDSKSYNSNIKNPIYTKIYDTIKRGIDEKEWGNLGTTKPLATIFLATNAISGEPKTFRKKFIDSIYKYLYETNREAILLTNQNVKRLNTELSKIEGTWEGFYDKNNDFLEKFNRYGVAELGKFFIKINESKVEYFYKSEYAVGRVDINGANFILQLKVSSLSKILPENYKEPISIFLNVGSRIIEDMNNIRHAVGIFLYINNFGTPKAGKCLIFKQNNGSTIPSSNSSQEWELELNNNNLEDKNLKIKNFFSEINTIDANHHDYVNIEN
ncbi:MAG: hypothetical protein MUF45_11515 [Spirosomaceae bacterium]|jgi:hypothetical protein|nr:hypothetical protein [Spirosomataceae bacterium]